MEYQEAIEALELKEITIEGNARRVTKFFEGLDIVISAMQELQMYKENKLCLIPEGMYMKQCEELDEYKKLGTLEEVQVAMEKRTPVKPKIKKISRTVVDIYDCVREEKADIYECSCCNSFICFVGGNHNIYHCFGCGQKLDWGEQK